VTLLERRTPPQGSAFRAWLGAMVRAFEGRVLPFTGNTAAICAALHIPDPRPERDAMIAASAMEHRMTLVTRNTSDFAAMGLQLLDPFAD